MLKNGVVHKVPEDLRTALISNNKALDIWNVLTPLARNEWICWITFVKKDETRKHHIKRLVNEIKEGKRRPCCWIGCIHRTDKAISPSVKGILARQHKLLVPKKFK
jgi:hypothetical protein